MTDLSYTTALPGPFAQSSRADRANGPRRVYWPHVMGWETVKASDGKRYRTGRMIPMDPATTTATCVDCDCYADTGCGSRCADCYTTAYCEVPF